MSKASDDFSEFGRLLVNKLVEPSSKIHVYDYTFICECGNIHFVSKFPSAYLILSEIRSPISAHPTSVVSGDTISQVL